ncbi:hypothetical protein [Cochlodiniinecator piscidefendens]|uniref:hypothetical protein n=1 Tax=Cochlodiniinecator piscidefendens TaxID=2715756 RepID=UPI0014073FC8|nr:hypothetical protein [Cochlodiniinecator piscidefendens]
MKRFLTTITALAMVFSATAGVAQTKGGGGQVPAATATTDAPSGINFGDDAGAFANDHECDDPRFTGWGTASSTSQENTMHDASDCRWLHNLGAIRLTRVAGESSPQECAIINFGDDQSNWVGNGECDDPRFAGPAAARIMNLEDIGHDASECRQMCQQGSVWLR